MKQDKSHILTFVSIIFMSVGVLSLLSAFGIFTRPGHLEPTVRHIEKAVAVQLKELDRNAWEALRHHSDVMLEELDLPEDMVIYRYVNDTLQAWVNRFSVVNDGISARNIVQRLTSPKVNLQSPLATLDSTVRFVNMGPKWYLAYMLEEGNCKVAAGYEVINPHNWKTHNGVNPDLKIAESVSIQPLTTSGGEAVSLNGQPLFKLVNTSMTSRFIANPLLIWLAVIFVIVSALFFVTRQRTLKSYAFVTLGLVVLLFLMRLWGTLMQEDVHIFSPSLFADGPVFRSLGDVLLMNISIVVTVAGLYLVRRELYAKIQDGRPRLALNLFLSLVLVLLVAYTHISLCSIIRNSNISLELYKLNTLSRYTFAVYISYISLLLTVPVLLLIILRKDFLPNAWRIAFSLLSGAYLVLVPAVFGGHKEADKLSVWASLLAVERDITLEIHLRRVENQIADDALIASLLQLQGTELTVRNRVLDTYFGWLPQSYGVSVTVLRDADNSDKATSWFNARIKDGEPISDGSRFLYTIRNNGSVSYTGVFLYFSPDSGLSRMMLCVDPLTDRNAKGYYSLLEATFPGQVYVPETYSYAKYRGRDLQLFRGNFAYATVMPEALYERVFVNGEGRIIEDGYAHFPTRVDDDELIVISRPVIGAIEHSVALLAIALLSFLILSALRLGHSGIRFEKHYYRTRITTVMMLSLIMTLVVMAVVSVFFVFRRNNANLHTMMSSQVGSLQGLLENRLGGVTSLYDIPRKDLMGIIQRLGDNTRTDIILYSLDGKAYASTSPGLLDNMMLDSRIEDDAYREILGHHKRYFLNHERINGIPYYNLYAPVRGSAGEIVAIMGTPYVNRNYDFEVDAVLHSMSILVVFFILLIVAHLSSRAVVNRMFLPLLEMGRKMSSAKLDSLEYIEYDRDDEIQTLVQSYNRMVTKIKESTLQLAQAERSKAWSEMARQVAHEIKNPLTPMKLQVQRLIRLKQKDDPRWTGVFDEVSGMLLHHIDILSEAANDFSAFARLYSEPYTEFDLDRMLREETVMFDVRDNIRFEYYGLSDAWIQGPRPQLVRVFVNMLNNAVQAIGDSPDGMVLVSLRNSSTSGFYDIVFEDNGPGVSEENRARLFTPNFTTKSSGTGLGLAISRNVLERCNATINYSRSFALGGACFTITYPKQIRES
ncbi:MAG: ATP-binding protein [Candidatus Cryptobacteroides sp.]|nr:ATP-binding protein [Candidatus Cryptobacteroides sp.]